MRGSVTQAAVEVWLIARSVSVMCDAEIRDNRPMPSKIREVLQDLDVASTLALAGRNALILHTMSRTEQVGELGHCPIVCSC